MNEIFGKVFYFLVYEVFGRIYSALVLLLAFALGMIGCILPKHGGAYMRMDSGDGLISEDGTAYIRWNDYDAWYGNGEERKCGWGIYTDSWISPYGSTYPIQKRFNVYTNDPSVPPVYLREHEFLDEFSAHYLRADVTLPDPMTELPVCLQAREAEHLPAITDKETIAAMLGSRVADETLIKPADGKTRIFYCYYEENSALIRVLMLTRLDDGTYLAAWNARYGEEDYWQIADAESIELIDAVFDAIGRGE